MKDARQRRFGRSARRKTAPPPDARLHWLLLGRLLLGRLLLGRLLLGRLLLGRLLLGQLLLGRLLLAAALGLGWRAYRTVLGSNLCPASPALVSALTNPALRRTPPQGRPRYLYLPNRWRWHTCPLGYPFAESAGSLRSAVVDGKLPLSRKTWLLAGSWFSQRTNVALTSTAKLLTRSPLSTHTHQAALSRRRLLSQSYGWPCLLSPQALLACKHASGRQERLHTPTHANRPGRAHRDQDVSEGAAHRRLPMVRPERPDAPHRHPRIATPASPPPHRHHA